MKKYDSYKNSGIEWIGEIPSHWEYSPVKYFTEIINGSTPSSSEESYWDGDIKWVTTDDLGKLNQKYIINTRRTITELGYKSCGTTIAPKGSVVISSRAPIGHLGILKIDACTNQGCKTLIPKNINSEFLHYYLVIGKNELEALGQGSTFKELPTSALKGFKIISPPIEEQTAIANYLDQKTSQIDDLIGKKERLIQLLEEERTAIINQAVTKGLDPTVPMKDSGIEWLGEIPAHWEVAKLKLFVDKITDGSHHSPPTEEQGKRYLSVKDIGNNEIKFDGCKLISENEFELLVRNGCQPIKGDILLTKDGTIGRAAIVSDDNDFVVLSSLGIIRPNHDKFDANFLREWLVSDLNVNQMLSLIQGSALTRITITIIKNLFVLVPPIEEQRSIMEWLKTKVDSINDICLRVEKEIDLLKEYKTALISEVVSGKVDVRDEKLN